MNNRSARIIIHELWQHAIVITIRDYCGSYLGADKDYTTGAKSWQSCKQISTASYRRLLALVNACGPVIETTDGYDVRIVAEWPPSLQDRR